MAEPSRENGAGGGEISAAESFPALETLGGDPQKEPSVLPTNSEYQIEKKSFGRNSLGCLLGVCLLLWNLLFGGIFAQSFFGGIIIIGWTYRAVRRWSLASFLKGAGRDNPSGWKELFSLNEGLRESERLPNWFVEQKGPFYGSERGRIKKFINLLSHSFWLNFKLGAQGILNTWALTLFPEVLWLAGWYMGWQISFTKLYEESMTGRSVSILGIFIFLAVMLYLPMAQIRQAATGRWKAFYHFKLIWALVRERWIMMLLLAGFYSLISLPITILKTAPAFFPEMDPTLVELSAVEALDYINRYFFFAGTAGFIGFVVLRWVTTKIYSSALLSCLKKGSITTDELYDDEVHIMDGLGLLNREEEVERHLILKVLKKQGSRALRFGGTAITLILWFTFVAQIYVSEFLVYHPKRGFLNQSLVQLPCFRYVPNQMEKDAEKEKA